MLKKDAIRQEPTKEMTKEETNEERKERFKTMSSDERKALMRKKMKAEGLQEGSGIPGKDLFSYDRNEIWDLIQVTRCLPELKGKQSRINKNNSLIPWLMISMVFSFGIVLYYDHFPFEKVRRELSVDVMFAD